MVEDEGREGVVLSSNDGAAKPLKGEHASTESPEQLLVKLREEVRVKVIDANATAKRWLAGAVLFTCIAVLCCGFVLFLYASQVQAPASVPTAKIPSDSAQYLRDRLNDLAESQKWVLLIFGGLAALITLVGATFQWLQLTEVRRERQVREPGQQTMLRQVNEVIETVQKTLAFRLTEETEVKQVREDLSEVQRAIAVFRKEAERRLSELRGQLSILKTWPRRAFATLDATQEAVTRSFTVAFSALPEKGFRDKTKSDLEMGQLTYFAGVIAFIQNDVVRAMELLDEAKECRDANPSSDNEQLQFWGAFVTYYMGLIEKNWGKLDKARTDFEDSLSRYGPDGIKKVQDEWLTRLSYAEVLTYAANTRARGRQILRCILDEVDRYGKERTEAALTMWARANLLLGNAEMADGELKAAAEHFRKVSDTAPNNYYAVFSHAQCLQKSDPENEEAPREFARSLDLIRDSGHLGTKREIGPLTGLHYVAMRAAEWSGRAHDAAKYRRCLYELLDLRRTVFNNYHLRVFVPDMCRVVAAEELKGILEDENRVERRNEDSC